MPEEHAKHSKDLAREPQTKDDSAAVKDKNVDPKKQPNKKFYKRAWFWLLVVGAVALVGGGILLGVYLSNQSKNKQIISEGWHDIVQQSKATTTLMGKIEDKEDFDDYTKELQKLSSTVNDKKFNASNMKYKAADAQAYEAFLNDFGKYSEESAKYAAKINEYTEDNADTLTDLASTAESATKELKSKAAFLNEQMPIEIFQIPKTLTEASSMLLTKELASKAKQMAEQAASAKDSADKKAVEATVTNYLNAFIAGNAATMRRYMTEAFQKEYDFNQLTAEARQYSYPASFRILTNQKIENEKYKVQANMVYKLRDGSGQYTVGNEMSVVYNSASATWLVDSVKESSSF